MRFFASCSNANWATWLEYVSNAAIMYFHVLGYEPNSYGEWQQQSTFAEPPLGLEGATDHWNHREDDAARSVNVEGLASHDGPASYAGSREGVGVCSRHRSTGDTAVRADAIVHAFERLD